MHACMAHSQRSELLEVFAVQKVDTMKLAQVVVAALTVLAAAGPFMQQVCSGRQPKIHLNR
jgi:hypothetical protein